LLSVDKDVADDVVTAVAVGPSSYWCSWGPDIFDYWRC